MKGKTLASFVGGIGVGVLLVIAFAGGVVTSRVWQMPWVDQVLQKIVKKLPTQQVIQKVVTEESVVTDTVAKVESGVVTVSYKQQQVPMMQQYFLDPFGMFGGQFPFGRNQIREPQSQKVDIGSGFIVDKSGLVVTNKHVVSEGVPSDYTVVLADNSTHSVEKIWRDPVNDLAILKISGDNLNPIELGDSDQLKVGQFVIAIGTALGEFRHTVTTGVVSGLGRGITVGDGFTGAEKLDNVIQTDAAINPGNSGGPLLNSTGQVIGVNVAVSQGANNIGFALPINVVKTSLQNFNTTGQFDRPLLGVQYQTLTLDQALMNNVPAGAYVVSVVAGSSAEAAGIQKGDIITMFDGQKVVDANNGIAGIVGTKKIGDKVEVEYYRDGKSQKVTVTLLAGQN
jgi:S1-C subfamily serine protease